MTNVEGQEQQTIDFLTDFIYVDSIRAKQFISQLLTSGVMTSYKEEIASSDTMNARMGINKILVGERTNIEQDSEKWVREYDTSSFLPKNLLDLLGENGFIKTDISTAKIGHLVLISGEYRIFDISFIEKAIPLFKKENKEAIPEGIDEFFNLLPKSLQLDIRDEKGNFYWSALKKESLLINVEDFILSNGITNRDKWFVLGILENLPKGKLKKGIQPHKFEDDKSNIVSANQFIQEAIGRKETSYSVTPVLIFRKITK